MVKKYYTNHLWVFPEVYVVLELFHLELENEVT